MPSLVNPYVFLLMISAGLSAALAITAWRRRPAAGAATLADLRAAVHRPRPLACSRASGSAGCRARAGSCSDLDGAIVLDVSPCLLRVVASSAYLDPVLGNLIDNAIKFSPDGREIMVSARPINGCVEICVAGQGVGIAQGQLDLIFWRFYQVDSTMTRRFGGMGIGLAL